MFNLAISPAQIDIVIKPGSSLTQAYQITNNSDQTLFLTTSVEPWLPTDTTGSLTYENATSNPNLSFSLSNTDLALGQNFKLSSGESRQLVLKIKSDPSTPLADSYYTFFISQSPSATLNQQNSITQAKIGSHILISASGTESPKISSSISRFFITPRFKDSFFSNINFNAQVDNSSDHYFLTQGQLNISKDDQTIKTFDLFPHHVLAKHSRQIACTLYFDQQKLPPQAVPCALKAPLWPGKYTATITLSETSQSISFYVFPYSLFFTILFFVGIFIAFKKLKPNRSSKHKKTSYRTEA
jgi:hypothetical protein